MEDNQKQGLQVAQRLARPRKPRLPAPAPPDVQSQTEPKKEGRYQDGIVIWQTPEDAKVPLLMRFNLNTQVRYLNTQIPSTLSPTIWAMSARSRSEMTSR